MAYFRITYNDGTTRVVEAASEAEVITRLANRLSWRGIEQVEKENEEVSKVNKTNTQPNDKTMYVRYVGAKACWTVSDGRFYMGEKEELTEEEQRLCEAGGGTLPLSVAVDAVAR
jgi:hypothetical protein